VDEDIDRADCQIQQQPVRARLRAGRPAEAVALVTTRTTMEGKNMKRTFDWDECSKRHRPVHFTWLKANHDKPIEEAAYIAAYQSLRSSDNRPKNARRYATAKLKGSYRRLREDFGFFV
jgi:ribonuclease HI